MKQKQSVLSIKDKQTIIWRLEKGEEGTKLALDFNITMQEISDIHKNKEKIPKFTSCVEMSEGLKWKSLKEGENNIDGINPIQTIQVWRMIDLAIRSRCNSLKQTSMPQHFRVL